MSFQTSNFSQLSLAVVGALFASTLVLSSAGSPASASGLGAGTYLDGTCNIADSIPSNHLTAETAFDIDTADKLWELTDCSLPNTTVYFKLTRDLDASTAIYAPTVSPIGYNASGSSSFSGVLDGGGFAISASMSSSIGVGLFAFIHSATISNLVINGSFTTTTNVNSPTTGAGGLAVRSGGQVNLISVTNSANLSGFRYVAGLIGYAAGPVRIQSSTNLGSITGTNDHVGGLVGWANDAATISGSLNTGTITGKNTGGLAGWVNGQASIVDSKNVGLIRGDFYSGGLLGRAEGNAIVSGSSNSGDVVAASKDYVGGLVGMASQGITISNSVNTGDLTAGNLTGGLLGYASGNAQIYDSSNTGRIAALNFTGGLLGTGGGTTLLNGVSNYGEVSGEQAVGGLLGSSGFSETLRATQAFSSATVSGTGDVGGLVGVAGGVANFDQNYFQGSATGGYTAGGFLGYAYYSVAITNSYVVGSVTGGSNQGPWIGVLNNSALVSIDNSYNTVAGSRANGVYGVRYASGNPVYTGGISGVSSFTSSDISSAGEAAKDSAIYTGWNFSSIWGFGDCDQESGLPILRFAGQVSSFYSGGCNAGVLNQEPVLVEAPSYNGPMIVVSNKFAFSGAEILLSGSKLDLVTSVYLEETQVEIMTQGPESMSIMLPTGIDAGVRNLIFFSSFGKLTVIGALSIAKYLEVKEVQAKTLSPQAILLMGKTRTLPSSAGKQPSLSENRSFWLKQKLKDSGLTRVVCTGVISETMTMHQKIQVRKLAKATCVEAAKYLANPSTWYQSKLTTKAAYVRKVMVTFRG